MIKHIQGDKLSRKHSVISESFPGAKVQDIADHIKPGLRRNPSAVIIHAGTNNIKSDSLKEIQRKMINITNSIKADHPKVKIAWSSVVQRTNDSSLNSKIDSLNQSLKNFCEHNNVDFICHENLEGEKHLNKGGLHLNRKGVFIFAKNLRQYISSISFNDWNRALNAKIIDTERAPKDKYKHPYIAEIAQNRGFKMGLLNVNSLTKHLDELQILMADQVLDILAINETKLDQNITDMQIGIPWLCLFS